MTQLPRQTDRVGNHGSMADSTDRADSAVFAMLFTTIGTVLIVNQPPHDTGFIIFCAVVAFAAAAVFAFRSIVVKR